MSHSNKGNGNKGNGLNGATDPANLTEKLDLGLSGDFERVGCCFKKKVKMR